jgi:hypothetical protein
MRMHTLRVSHTSIETTLDYNIDSTCNRTTSDTIGIVYYASSYDQ